MVFKEKMNIKTNVSRETLLDLNAQIHMTLLDVQEILQIYDDFLQKSKDKYHKQKFHVKQLLKFNLGDSMLKLFKYSKDFTENIQNCYSNNVSRETFYISIIE